MQINTTMKSTVLITTFLLTVLCFIGCNSETKEEISETTTDSSSQSLTSEVQALIVKEKLFKGVILNPKTGELGRTFEGSYVFAKRLDDDKKTLWLGFKNSEGKQVAFSYFDKSVKLDDFLSATNEPNQQMVGKSFKLSLVDEKDENGASVYTKVVAIEEMKDKKVLSKGVTWGQFSEIVQDKGFFLEITEKKGKKTRYQIIDTNLDLFVKLSTDPQSYQLEDLEIKWQLVEYMSSKEKVKELLGIELLPPQTPSKMLISYVMKLNRGEYKEAHETVLSDRRLPFNEFMAWADRDLTKNKTVKSVMPVSEEDLDIPSSDPKIKIAKGKLVTIKILYDKGGSKTYDAPIAEVDGRWYIAD